MQSCENIQPDYAFRNYFMPSNNEKNACARRNIWRPSWGVMRQWRIFSADRNGA